MVSKRETVTNSPGDCGEGAVEGSIVVVNILPPGARAMNARRGQGNDIQQGRCADPRDNGVTWSCPGKIETQFQGFLWFSMLVIAQIQL
ncbi:hypothetical protein PV11_07306 [Exophiala sideris]|uniref:Uncharacterized protein n=1 Tax=Exophiala sideris TaxID=1016849 RepID=A0A0D1WX59_9EURO|nr:hypothetical protein PV11_07306 [Exophiala sideris]